MAIVQGKDVELHFSNIEWYLRGGQKAFDAEAKKQLTAQKSELLDSPLALERGGFYPTTIENEISIRFAIDSKGNVINTEVTHIAIGNPEEDIVGQTIYLLLNYWHFYPPMRAGKPTGYCCAHLIFENN
jgi:hypothetical protein